jgi:hypothetical protein
MAQMNLYMQSILCCFFGKTYITHLFYLEIVPDLIISSHNSVNVLLLSINISEDIKINNGAIPNTIIGYKGLVNGSMFGIFDITPNNA